MRVRERELLLLICSRVDNGRKEKAKVKVKIESYVCGGEKKRKNK